MTEDTSHPLFPPLGIKQPKDNATFVREEEREGGMAAVGCGESLYV